jgi:very-short-patch-repair endonuclease
MNTRQQNKTMTHCQTSRNTKEVNNVCVICDTKFTSVRKAKCCSERCRQVRRSNKRLTGTPGYDYIECPVCNQRVKQITAKHARSHGYDSVAHMKESLGMTHVTCQKIRDQVSGENNPGYQHGGRFSKFSENFIHGYDAHWHTQHVENMREHRSENKGLFKTNLEYWLVEHDGDLRKAKESYRKFQTRDLEWFVDRYGETEGPQRHKLKTERWIKSMPRHNFSAISQELFTELMQLYNKNHESVYYATYERADMAKYENKEYRLQTSRSFVLLDFVDLRTKKVIEFDGDYWHSEVRANPAREKRRDQEIRAAGYEVLHVGEQDYKNNKQQVLETCLAFLKQ